MTLQKLTYDQKTNPKPVIDRSKQSTAEDFNEIKDVVNPAIDKINEFDDIIEGVEGSGSKKSFANVAAATTYYNDAGTNPKPDDGVLINIEDTNKLYKWASGEASRVLFVKDNISAASIAAAQQSANDAQNAADAAQGTANNAMQNAANAQQTADSATNKANENENRIGELGALDTDEDSNAVDAINEVNEKADYAQFIAGVNKAHLEKNESFKHAERVRIASGTSLDVMAMDEKIRRFRDWKYLMLPHSRKSGKVFGQLPRSGNADAGFTRNSIAGEFDSDANNHVIGANYPRFDYRKPYVHSEDDSYYQLTKQNQEMILLNDVNVGNVDRNSLYVYAYVYIDAYPDTANFVARIAGKGSYGASYGIMVRHDGLLYAGVRSNTEGEESVFSENPVPLNTWVFIEYVRDAGNNAKLYVDGVKVGEKLDDGAIRVGDDPTGFGVSSYYILGGNGMLLEGKIKRCGMWNFAPSDQQRQDNRDGKKLPSLMLHGCGVNLVSSFQESGFPLDVFTDNGDGSYTAGNNGTSWQGFEQPASERFPIKVGEKYRLSFDYTLNSGVNDLQLFIGNGGVGSNYGNNILTAVEGYNEIEFEILVEHNLARLVTQVNSVSNFTVSNVRLEKIGSAIDLSSGKTNYGEELVENGHFDNADGWTIGTGWNISNGVASCNGTQTAFSAVVLPNLFETYKNYIIKYRVDSISAGTVRVFAGGTAGGEFRSQPGVYYDILRSVGTPALYIEGNPDFIGVVDNVSVKEVSEWYDLNSGINCLTRALLKRWNGFGENRYGVEKEPSLYLEGHGSSNHFLNSDNPVSQTVTGLTIGETYTLNGKGTGIIELLQVGTSFKAVCTEVRPVTFIARSTSVDITLKGVFDWVNLTDSSLPFNHIPTSGSSVAKSGDIFFLQNIQANGLIGKTKGSWYIEFGNDCYLKDRPSGSQFLLLTENVVSGQYLKSIGFWTAGTNNIQIRVFDEVANQELISTNIDINGAKVLFTWNNNELFMYVNGVLVKVWEDIILFPYEQIYDAQLTHTYIRLKTMALTDRFIQSAEAIELTT